MDRLDAMALFVAAVEEGSLAGAARRHGRSPAAVTRAIAMLEDRAGEPLMLRSTRSLNLTERGEAYLDIWRDVLATLVAAESDRPGCGAPMRRAVTITAPELFGRMHLLPLVEQFLDQHPQVTMRILTANRIMDLVGEGVDLALRLAPLPDSSLTAIRLGEMRSLCCAAPEYLARAGTPDHPQHLTRHACIGFRVESGSELWPFVMEGGRARSVRVATRLSVDHAGATIDAALRGQGIIHARAYQVADHLAAGRLRPLLEPFETAPAPVHLLFHPDRARNGAVRAFIDHAVPALKRVLADMAETVRH